MSELYFKILAAVAPAIILAIIMIRKDKRPEPIGWLFAAVGLGFLCGPAGFSHRLFCIARHSDRHIYRGIFIFIHKCCYSGRGIEVCRFILLGEKMQAFR